MEKYFEVGTKYEVVKDPHFQVSLLQVFHFTLSGLLFQINLKHLLSISFLYFSETIQALATYVNIGTIKEVFELLPKTCNFTICSIFSNSGHVGWCTASPDTILKLDTLVMIQTKFGITEIINFIMSVHVT
jgi:hypothetical protein